MGSPDSETSPEILAVVVNWNAGHRLTDCVRSLLDQQGVRCRVRVVDNASTDDSLERLNCQFGHLEQVEIVEAGQNLGFGRGVNLGVFGDVSGSDTAFAAAMNTDVILEPDTLAKMVGFLESHPEAGLVGPRLRDDDGRAEPSVGYPPTLGGEVCRKFLLHLVFPFAKFRRRSPECLARVGWVTGACMAFRRDAFQQVGGMDEAIFMYYEDIDLCIRLSQSGWGVFHLPQAIARHTGKASSRLVMEEMLVTSAVSHRYLMEKHLSCWASKLLAELTPLEMHLRSLLWRIQAALGGPDVRSEAPARLAAYRRIPQAVSTTRLGDS